MIELEDPDPYLVLTDPDPGGPKTYKPDPQHWSRVRQMMDDAALFSLFL